MLTKNQIRKIRSETSDDMAEWVRISTLPSYVERWFLAARDEAFKSNFHAAKIGCVILYKNHIIGRGHNQYKTDPMQKFYNEKYREWTNSREFGLCCDHSLHAEIDALKNISYPIAQQVIWKKVEVYVYRVAPGLDNYSGLALPCAACAHALQDSGILGVHYTTGRIDKPFGYCEL